MEHKEWKEAVIEAAAPYIAGTDLFITFSERTTEGIAYWQARILRENEMVYIASRAGEDTGEWAAEVKKFFEVI